MFFYVSAASILIGLWLTSEDTITSQDTADSENTLTGENSMSVTIKGKLILPSAVSFPAGSSAVVKCVDSSLMDAPSVTLGTINIDISNTGSVTELHYTLQATVPRPGEFSMSAVINVGWKRSGDGKKWIQKGDFHNDTHHDIEIEEGVTQYESDVEVVQYK